MEEVKYKFTAIGRNSTKEVFPQNGNTLAVTWEKEEERAYFSKKLKGKMLFTGADFHWLYVFESSQYRCEPITLLIEKKCSGVFEEFFVARLILNNADWDLDQCTASIEAEVEDKYTCYNDSKDKEVNLISGVYPKQVVQLVQGALEYVQCSGTTLDPGQQMWCGEGEQSDGWVIQSFYQTNYNPGGPMNPEDGSYNVTYVRETIYSEEPLEAPWIDIGSGQYARQPALYGFRSFGGQYDYGYDYQVGGSIDNGMKLKDCFQTLVNNACYPMRLKSKFFNWDPDPEMNKNLLNYKRSTVGADLGSSGYTIPNSNPYHKVTDYIKVIPGADLWLQNPGTVGGDMNNWFYDINKNPVSLAPPVPGASSPVKIADIPLNVHFVRYQYYDMDVPGSDVMLYLGTSPQPFSPYDFSNYVTGEASKVENLILFQKSDVKRPSGTGNASIANTTLEKMLKDICNMFNLKWDIDEDDNFIIEHVSFFQKGVGLNLVGRRDARLRSGMNKYSYDVDNMPRRELFQMADEKYTYGDFRGVPITYSNSCVGQGEKEDKDWIVESIMTDVSLVLNNPTSDSQVVADDGFVLIACDEQNNILSEPTILGGNTLNNPLSWSHLHVDYWRHDRVFNTFMMNNVQTEALSVVPTKKQVKLNVSLCCGEVFDPEELINTEMGEGAVSEATFNLYQDLLEVTLLYPSDENLVTNNPPVAVNDEAETFVNLAIDIDVLANDTDDGGTINPGSLNIVYPGSTGTVSIVDGKIRYVPNTGFVGTDYITYNVKDEWEAISNTGTVTITVKPGSPLPIAGDDNFSTARNVTLTVGSVLDNDTGDGTLTCVPETKATSAGGSVQIYSSGSFVYTPPTNYVGADGFDYTLKDSNDNTDTGHVNITVFTPVSVYVRYTEGNTQNDNDSFPCPPEPGFDPVMVDRMITTIDQTWNYYSDPAGTIPLNVDGYGLVIKMEQVRTGSTSGTFPYDHVASGTSDQTTDAIISFYQESCPGDSTVNNYTQEYNILPSPNYTIL